MKLTFPIASVALLLTVLSPLHARAEPAQSLRWVLADQVRVRAGPTTADRVDGSLSRGAELNLKAPAEGDFCLVEGEGLKGYVACKYLRSERVAPPKSGENGIDTQQRWVSGNNVTLREKADINASATGRLLINAIVKLVNADVGNGYCEVNSVDGLSGYTACRYLATNPVVAVNYQTNKNVDKVQPANIALSIAIQPVSNAERIEPKPKPKSLLQRSETAVTANKVSIGVIPKKYCDVNSDNYNDHVYAESKPGSSPSQCILTFLRTSSSGTDFEYESEALMNINGAITYLHKKKDTGTFESDDGTVSAMLNVQETGTTCVEGEDKCCGSDYAGTLSVTTAIGRASVRVSYYRGG